MSVLLGLWFILANLTIIVLATCLWTTRRRGPQDAPPRPYRGRHGRP